MYTGKPVVVKGQDALASSVRTKDINLDPNDDLTLTPAMSAVPHVQTSSDQAKVLSKEVCHTMVQAWQRTKQA